MSMTYIQLCRRTRQECGIPAASNSIPSAVTGQAGELQKIVDFVAQAWVEIQNKHDSWRWMRRAFTVTTTTDQSEYASTACTDTTDVAAISRFKRWLISDDTGYPTFSIYATASGVAAQQWLIYLPWGKFRSIYRFGTQTSGSPVHISITPAGKFALGPAPDSTGYTVGGDYQMGAKTLAADGDTPDMPGDFHMCIVYEAMKKYAGFESAPEVWDRAKSEGGPLMWALERDQLPEITVGGAIA